MSDPDREDPPEVPGGGELHIDAPDAYEKGWDQGYRSGLVCASPMAVINAYDNGRDEGYRRGLSLAGVVGLVAAFAGVVLGFVLGVMS